ncbi:cyclic nucleotide-binding domain-containing protein 1 isoform X2 [Eptesicus fuscus]|uniref:cyclic nucleotide-binding domain-containing protein 1 isoform X2 n=1 Tax=Eptesicus fuscus TaxID=29078 RepID=UPI0024041CD4|nr:cyclic nucleotide-binding domain-containing protein 1 isoform X2 [Eptesicus fuscus]
MPVSSLSSAILSHMKAINNVPPPAPRSVPGLKLPKHIDYGQLDALFHVSRQQANPSSLSILSAHNDLIKNYPKIFLQRKARLPRLSQPEEKRKLSEDTEESQRQQSEDDAHNIAIYVKQVLGSHPCGPKNFEEKVEEFLAILKKLPIHRTLHEHKTVWKMLKTVPDLTYQLTDDHLKTLSKNVISETWIKGSTVVGNDGFFVILRGLARAQTQLYKSLIDEEGSSATFIPQSFHSYVCSEDLQPAAPDQQAALCGTLLGPWSTFGTLEVTAQIQSDPAVYSVVTEEDCELLKISAANYAKLKSEKTKLENKQIVKLIRGCPYYEEWPTLSIHELVLLVKWKRFPRGHVIVESGNIIPFVAYINSGHCNIYRDIVGFVRLQPKRVKKVRKLVYMGQLQRQESFGELSALLQLPFTCTVVAGAEVEAAVIQDKDLQELDPVTQQLMLQTAKPTFGHLTDRTMKEHLLSLDPGTQDSGSKSSASQLQGMKLM